MSRRSFLLASGAVVTASVLAVPGLVQQGRSSGATAETPGHASQRIEGVAKVTGQKVYASDFRPRDMPGWPARGWHALYLNATTTARAFAGLDLTVLPIELRPRRVILGDMLTGAMRAPAVTLARDLHLEAQAAASFDRPASLMFDLVVQRGNRPDFLGQAVALLLYDDVRVFRAARQALQFRADQVQIYGPDIGPNPAAGVPFDPVTVYVKDDGFSYATNADDYDRADQVAADLEVWLASRPDLTLAPLLCETQAMDPMFMEPETGLAWADAPSGTLHLVLGTQSPDGDIRDVVSMYDSPGAPFPIKAVNLTSCYPGGGFGGRDSSPFSLLLALAAGFTEGAPVRLALDRYEQFQTGLKRHPCRIEGRLAVAPDMKIAAVQARLWFDGGGRKNLSPYVASLAALCMGGAYAVPRADVRARAVQSANVPGGSQRGFGGPKAFFAVETALDDIAAVKGWDPLALRRRNLARPEDTTVVGGPFAQSLRLDEILDVVEAHPLWARRAGLKADHAREGRLYGTGLALSLQSYGTGGDGVIAGVSLGRDGALTVRSDAVDMGNGSATTLGVVVGPILGANAAHVRMGDSALFGESGLVTGRTLPDGGKGGWDVPLWTAKAVGSSSACLTGLHQVHVVQETARALLTVCLLPAAARLWGVPPPPAPAVIWEDGLLRLQDGSRPGLTLAQIAAEAVAAGLPVAALGHAFFQGDWVRADYPVGPGKSLIPFALDGLALAGAGEQPIPVPRQNTRPPPAQASRWSRFVWAPCASVVAVTVDAQSGQVQVENVLSVLNAGRVHVPELVSGQSQGGVAMALSQTLLEDMPPGMEGPANGLWNLDRYHVARMTDVPLAAAYAPGVRSQELVILPEVPDDGGTGRGIGEAVMCAVPAAISNALRDATGVRFSSLPITAEKIVKGLRG